MKNFTKLIVILLLSCLGSLAQAHTSLHSSKPADQQLLQNSPEDFALVFTGKTRLVDLTLFDENANPIDFGFEPRMSERVSFKTALASPLSPGVYVLKWTVLGEDGHRITGTILFGVDDQK